MLGANLPESSHAMLPRRSLRCSLLTLSLLSLVCAGLVAGAQESPSPEAAPVARPPMTQAQEAPVVRASPQALSQYDKTLFERPFDPTQLTFLTQASGTQSGDLFRDKQFRKLMKAFVPDCTFHYGRDMSLNDALDMTIAGSRTPVSLRDGRYLTLSGARGPYLAGRAFFWIDLQDGIGLGAFFFTPTNGEPTLRSPCFRGR